MNICMYNIALHSQRGRLYKRNIRGKSYVITMNTVGVGIYKRKRKL